ncbi:c-type cytochrome [Celeribacter persicus]|jgi:Cytochrome c2|uniref:Cytochrome c n=1 Tax=Celeribacter persicus TaxID=1651082 RepID=A0A2T5HIK8_9RHOB|nr:cytochrome C [Celeribacter persicus]PTQ71410.1 cytochrome c [Celeribacter persicus]
MTKLFAFTAAALLATSAAAVAGDPDKGAKDFNKCKACHMIVSDAGETIVKGGKTGPNLYGVIGRPVASYPDFKYGDGILAVGATGMVWTEELITEYAVDPTKFIDTHGGSGRSKMTFKLKDASDVVAYLATFSAAPEAAEEAPAEEAPASE